MVAFDQRLGENERGDSSDILEEEWVRQRDLEKDAQCESCCLSFIWGKMRTTAQETTLQRALRDCSKEARGRSVYM